MPTGTVIKTNPDGTVVVRTDSGQTLTLPGTQVKSAAPASPEFKLRSEVAPENARFPKLGPTGYKAADFINKLLPGAGATAGGVIGAPSVGGAVLGAGIGEMTGSEIEKQINELLYKDVPKEGAGDTALRLGTQFGIGAATEAGARGASSVLNKLINPLKASAKTVEAAESGSGIRLTPGEATNNGLMKKAESVLGHIPGGSGPMESFRVAQEGEVDRTLDEQLNALSTRGLSAEQVGKQVQDVVKKAEADSIKSQSAYAEVKKVLGLKPNATKAEIEAELAQPPPEDNLQSQFREHHAGPVARNKLAEANTLYRQEQNAIQTKIVGSILKTQKPEIIGTFFEKAGLKELRQMQTLLPPEVKQDVARNVLENILKPDAQTGEVGAKALATRLQNLTEGRGRLIFGKQYDSIKEASELMNRIGSEGGEGAGKMHMARFLMGGMTAPLVGLITGHPVAAGAALAGEVAAPKLLALALTNPRFSAGALKILRGFAVASARGIPYVGNEVFGDSPAIEPLPRLMDGAPTQ